MERRVFAYQEYPEGRPFLEYHASRGLLEWREQLQRLQFNDNVRSTLP